MYTFSLKKTLLSGIALGLPLMIAGYAVYRLLHIFEKLISPLEKRIGIENLFGEWTPALLATMCLVVLVFLLGLLMQFGFISRVRRMLGAMMLKTLPSLNHLEMMAAEKLQTGTTVTSWRPVLIENEEGFIPAYLVEETSTMVTFSKVKIPGTEPGEILISKKENIRYTEIPLTQFRQFNKQFGKGYISIIEK